MGERRTGSDNMKFELTITSEDDRLNKVLELPFFKRKGEGCKWVFYLGEVDVTTIDEIIQLLNAMDDDGIRQEIVIGRNDRESVPYIEIYNDYRE